MWTTIAIIVAIVSLVFGVFNFINSRRMERRNLRRTAKVHLRLRRDIKLLRNSLASAKADLEAAFKKAVEGAADGVAGPIAEKLLINLRKEWAKEFAALGRQFDQTSDHATLVHIKMRLNSLETAMAGVAGKTSLLNRALNVIGFGKKKDAADSISADSIAPSSEPPKT